MRRQPLRPWVFPLLALFLHGCFLAPTYKRPPVDTPPAFKEQATPASASASAGQWKTAAPGDTLPKGPWWEMFGDPQLNALEQKVVISNQNVKQAEAQFREARGLVRQTQSAYFPTVTTVPSVTRSFGPNNLNTRSNNTNNTNNGTANIFDLPVTAAWEPDIWGAVTFAVRTAKAEAQASEAQLEGMELSMQAELASDYFAMAAIDMETALLNSAMDSYDQALKLTIVRFNGGVASNADVAEARTQLETTRAQATDLGIQRAQDEHAIAVLIGQTPATFSLPALQIRSIPPTIPVGLPSQLLERRPDIATSERLIVAANGQIGLARAAYFPTLSLTASGGYESNTVSQWLSWPNRFWTIGASAAETLVDFGRRRAVTAQAQAAYDAQVAAYRQTVLSAFEEVEDNLAALRILAQEAAEQDDAAKSADESLRLEIDRYKAGIVSYLDVITTQNIALTNERNAVDVLGRRMVAAVTLIRAIGGGWDISQLPWPHNFESLPTASTAPVTAVAIPNPPETRSLSYAAQMPDLMGGVAPAISSGTVTTPAISTGTLPVVSSTTVTPVMLSSSTPIVPVLPSGTTSVLPVAAPAAAIPSAAVSSSSAATHP